jgi:hypothetical protein
MKREKSHGHVIDSVLDALDAPRPCDIVDTSAFTCKYQAILSGGMNTSSSRAIAALSEVGSNVDIDHDGIEQTEAHGPLMTQEELATFNFELNCKTAFYQLPVEVIQSVLNELQIEDCDDSHSLTDPGWTGMTIEWVRAMQLCRRMREAALGAAVLWSFIDVDHESENWHELCVSRASEHSLYLRGSLRHDTDDLTRRIFDLIPRSYHVQLVIPSQEELADDPVVDEKLAVLLKNLMDKHINVQQPRLRILQICNLTQFWIFANAAFVGGAPNSHLTSLVLHGFHIEDVPAMPVLRKLVIRQVRLDTDCSRLRKVLMGTPLLSFLRIDEPISDRIETPATLRNVGEELQKTPPVCLPMLAVLHLCGAHLDIGRLILTLPDPSFELMIHIRDMNTIFPVENHMNPEMRPVLQEYSQTMYRRIVSFLHKAAEEGVLQRHELVLGDAVDFDFWYRATVVELLPDKSDVSTRRLSARLPIYDQDFSSSRINFSEIGRYAERVRVVYADRLFDFSEFLTESENLKHLIIAHFSPPPHPQLNQFTYSGTHCNHEQSPSLNEIIGVLLRKRAQAGKSIQKLTFITAVKTEWNGVNPKGLLDVAAAEEWSAAGWVHELECIPCKGICCDETTYHKFEVAWDTKGL